MNKGNGEKEISKKQDTIIYELPEDVLIRADKMPQPPGGMQKYLNSITENIIYPEEALKRRIQGTVLVRTIIDAQGNITYPQVITGKGLGHGCDEEAIRAVMHAGKWTPGENNGKTVKIQQVIPVVFRVR